MRLQNLIVPSIAVLALACAAPPEPAPPDHGAGTVLKVSDALDTIVPGRLHD